MKRITKFRGILEGVDLSLITPELIELLTKKDIMYEMKNSLATREHTKLQFPLEFQGKLYELNRDIIKDIYLILKEAVEMPANIIMEIERINTATHIKINKKNKLKTLIKLHEECFKDVKYINDYNYYLESYKDFQDFQEFKEFNDFNVEHSYSEVLEYIRYLRFSDNSIDYGKHVYMDDQPEWQSCAFSEIENNSIGLINYLTSKSNIISILNDKKDTEDIFSNYYPFTRSWKSYFKMKVISEYIYSEITRVKNNSNHKNIVSTKKNGAIQKLTAIQKVILFDKISNWEKWNELSVNKKSEILSLLFDYHKDTIRKSLDIVDPNKTITSKKLSDDKTEVNNALVKLGLFLGHPTD